MASPQLDGYGASRSGVALASRPTTSQSAPGPSNIGTSNLLLIGIGVALGYIAYVYRRVL